MSRFPWLTGCLCLALTGGCRAALAFPDPTAEGADLESCGDGVDQDLDGAVDCADPDCDGSCTEEAPRCNDGRDNDRDGAFDTIDPGCWRERALSVERCASIEGFDAVLESGAAFGWRGRADRVALEGRSYFGASTEPARIAWATPISGAVEGTELSYTIFHDGVGRGALTLVPLSSVSDDLIVAPTAASFRVSLEDDEIFVVADMVVGQFTRVGSTPTDRYEVELSLGALSQITVRPPGQPGTTITFDRPAAWAEDEPLLLLFEADVAPSPIAIGDITVHRPSIEHCGRRVPEIDAVGENVLFDLARTPTELCVLASVDDENANPRRLRVFGSSDEGRSFEDLGPLAAEGVTLGASLSWDAGGSRLVGVIAGQDTPSTLMPSPEWARVVGGPDCAHLAVGEALDLPLTGLNAAGADYTVLSDGSHRLTFDYVSAVSGRRGLRAFRSLDGRTDFSVTTIDVGDGFHSLRERGAIPSVDTVLDLRLAWVELGGQVFLFRELEDGSWVEEPVPVLFASSTPGSFDRGRLQGPRALMDAPPTDGETPWRGRLFYNGTSGAACPTCGRIGSANLTVSP